MRSLLIASAGVALLASGAAGAQRVVAHGPGASFPAPGMAPHAPVPPRAPMMQGGMAGHPVAGRPIAYRQRWGSKVDGRWYAGNSAPGGWRGYHRPYRGLALPSYWISPSFVIADWSSYGLSRPPYGYNWSRYYDDAVLIDGRGSVYDSVSDVEWDRYDRDSAYDDRGYDERADGGRAPDDRGYDDRAYVDRGDSVYAGPEERGYRRRDNGAGGAVTGAVVGGVAGNLIGGRGNRLGGTLIGAGVGAAAGYAIDKHEDDRRGPPPPPRVYHDDRGYAPGASYAPPTAPAPYYPPVHRGAPAGWVSPDGRTSVVTTTSGGYYGTGVTTVTVQTAPIVTTTTEVYEDTVTYSRPKKVYRKHVWRPKPRCSCR